MSNALQGYVEIEWLDGTNQFIDASEFSLEESSISQDQSCIYQVYKAFFEHPEDSTNQGEIHVSVNIARDGSVNSHSGAVKYYGDFEIVRDEIIVVGHDNDDDDTIDFIND